MKKAAVFCLTLLLMPAVMAESSFAVTQSQKNYCRNKAQRYADDKSVGSTVGGAIGGAVVGGIIGGIVTGGRGSGIGTGAAIGAGAGGVTGAVRSSQTWKNYYWKKYNSCLSNYY